MKATLSRRGAVYLVALAAAAAFAMSTPAAIAEDIPLAIKGYDPVAYFSIGKPVPGLPEFEYEWDEHRYRFARAEHRELFKADPVRYAPQFAKLLRHGAHQRRDPRGQPGELADQRRQALYFRRRPRRAGAVPAGSSLKTSPKRTRTAHCCEGALTVGGWKRPSVVTGCYRPALRRPVAQVFEIRRLQKLGAEVCGRTWVRAANRRHGARGVLGPVQLRVQRPRARCG